MSRSANSNIIDKVLPAVFFAAVWAFFNFGYAYHLLFKEQITFLCFNSSYLASLLEKPAFLALFVGDFFTQFFIFKFTAPLITVLFIILLWESLRRFLKGCGIERHASLLALLPCAAEAALSCQFEYPLAMTCGAVISAWLAVLCLNIRNKYLKYILSLLLCAAIFPLVGAHSILFALLLLIGNRDNLKFFIALTAVYLSALFIEWKLYILMPAETFCYPICFGYSIRRLYLFTTVEAALLTAFFTGKSRLNNTVVDALLCLSLAIGGICLMYKSQEEYDLKLSTLAYRGQWDKVKAISAENPFQSQTGAYYSNICSSMEGRLAKDLLDKYQPLIYGLFFPVSGDESYIKIITSIDALMEVGDYNQAQHSALVGMTFSPRQASARMIHKLAEIAIYNGDRKAAAKYLGLLESTLFYRKWAKDAGKLLEERDTRMNDNIDTVYKVNEYQRSLRNIIDSNPGNIKAIDYLLCFDLLQKEIMTFKRDYDKYYMPIYSGTCPPRVYQEALEMLEAEPYYLVSEEVQNQNQDFLNGNELAYKKSYWFYFKYAQQARQ